MVLKDENIKCFDFIIDLVLFFVQKKQQKHRYYLLAINFLVSLLFVSYKFVSANFDDFFRCSGNKFKLNIDDSIEINWQNKMNFSWNVFRNSIPCKLFDFPYVIISICNKKDCCTNMVNILTEFNKLHIQMDEYVFCAIRVTFVGEKLNDISDVTLLKQP